MWNRFFAKGAILAGLSVILGAFAAHGLKKYLDSGQMDMQMLQNFETAARYQMYHSLALIACAFAMKLNGENRLLKTAGWLFAAGILFFSGSLYLLSTRNVIGMQNWQWLGPVTPLGGLCFIIGWLLLAVSVLRNKNN